VADLPYRPLFAFFLVGLGSRRVAHVGVTRHPTDAWVAQRLREATPYGERSRYLVRDNDAKYGPRFAHLAAATGIAVVRMPVRAPRVNAIAERFLRSVRREYLEHLLLLGEAHLRRVLGAYVVHLNHDRPHKGLGQGMPATGVSPEPARHDAGCTTLTRARPEAASGGHTRGPAAVTVTRLARSVPLLVHRRRGGVIWPD
jgi:transposase InsO family protein